MKEFTKYGLIFFTAIYLVAGSGCSERMDEPFITNDSTIIFPPKKKDGISAKITFCKKVSQKTGKRIGINHVFAISEKADVFAFTDLKNCSFENERPLMFHLDWIDPEGNSIFQKQIDLLPGDSTTTLYSSISATSDKRQSGRYLFKVYLFRELIAEKYFTLLPEGQLAPSLANTVHAKIVLTGDIDNETQDPIGQDSVFVIGTKGNIYGFAEVNNLLELNDEELEFTLSWIGPDGESWFKKRFDLLPEDSSTTLSSSISLDPEKRQAGPCYLQLFLFDDLVAEKKFILHKLPEPKLPDLNRISSKIEFCKYYNSKTGEISGVDSVFLISEEGWIHAVINLINPALNNKQKLDFEIEWIDPSGITFYRKQIDILPGTPEFTISSAISVNSEKRVAGIYKVKLTIFKKQLTVKSFRLRN